MTYLKRRRRSFTLLELMVAFIIMAILSAIAIPSLIGVVGNDQATADGTTAISLVDALYYNALAANSTAPVDYTSLIGSNNITAEWEDSGYTVPYVDGDGGTIYFQFGDPIYAEINVGNGYTTANSPQLDGTSGSAGGTTTTTAPVPNGAPTDIVVTFAGLNPYGSVLYNISWTPGTNSDDGAVYQVATSPDLEGFSGGGGEGNTCTSHYISDTSCTLAMELDPSVPSSFTPQVTEQDNGPGAIGYGSLVTFTPPVPTDLVVTPVGDGSFTVSWTGAYSGDTYNATVLPDAGGDIYLYCDPSNPSELQYSVTSCTITAEQAAGIGSFVVEVGEDDATYGSGATFSDDVSNP